MDSVGLVAAVFGASPYFCDLYLQESSQGVLVTEIRGRLPPPQASGNRGEKIIMIHLQRVLQSKDPFFVHSW